MTCKLSWILRKTIRSSSQRSLRNQSSTRKNRLKTKQQIRTLLKKCHLLSWRDLPWLAYLSAEILSQPYQQLCLCRKQRTVTLSQTSTWWMWLLRVVSCRQVLSVRTLKTLLKSTNLQQTLCRESHLLSERPTLIDLAPRSHTRTLHLTENLTREVTLCTRPMLSVRSWPSSSQLQSSPSPP